MAYSSALALKTRFVIAPPLLRPAANLNYGVAHALAHIVSIRLAVASARLNLIEAMWHLNQPELEAECSSSFSAA